jgi:hypothetical protein
VTEAPAGEGKVAGGLIGVNQIFTIEYHEANCGAAVRRTSGESSDRARCQIGTGESSMVISLAPHQLGEPTIGPHTVGNTAGMMAHGIE